MPIPSTFAPASPQDFPIFSRTVHGKPFVYLDAGATSQLPQAVLDAVRDFETRSRAAVSRSSHLLAGEATLAFDAAREKVANFVGVGAGELVWTSGSTMSLNLLAYAFSNATVGRGGAAAEMFALGAGDTIVVTRAEHHANLVPWQELCARTGAQLRWLDLDREGRIDLNTLDVIDESARVVAFTHVSNVTGAVSPVAEIVTAAKKVGALTVLDACQSVPHMPVNFSALDVDFAVFSGHKMLAPTGIGALYGRAELLAKLPPFLTGGSMIETVTMESSTYTQPPTRFEAGTQPVTQAIGLGAAVDYLSEIGMDTIAAHERELTGVLLEGISQIRGVRVLGPLKPENRTGVVAFELEGVHPHDVGQILDADGVAVRTGHHCAQPIHAFFDVHASSRVSLAPYNTRHDVEIFLDSLAKVRPFFGLEG